MRPLTDLEGAALGFVVRAKACTPYAVKEAFRTSPSEFWSGSAGAVYPMIGRLQLRGLLVSKSDKSDGRARHVVSATAAGKAALLDWLTDADRAAELGFDPLRTRLFFSDLAPKARFARFLAKTERLLARDSAPPQAAPDHVALLHTLWLRLRRDALRAFVRAR
jgi:DNA-binding PadR family transcriptional regulator